MEIRLTPEAITALKREFLEAGLILVPKEAGILGVGLLEKRLQQDKVMRRKHVSTHTIEKYQLIHSIKTRQSVVNMMKRGDLKENEDWFFDASGNRQVLTLAIRRLNGE